MSYKLRPKQINIDEIIIAIDKRRKEIREEYTEKYGKECLEMIRKGWSEGEILEYFQNKELFEKLSKPKEIKIIPNFGKHDRHEGIKFDWDKDV